MASRSTKRPQLRNRSKLKPKWLILQRFASKMVELEALKEAKEATDWLQEEIEREFPALWIEETVGKV